MKPTRIFAVALLTLALPALAGAQSREEMQVYADLRMLQEEVAKLQLAVNQLIEMNKAQSKRLDDQADATLKGFANEQVLIKDQATALNTLQEKLNDNTLRVTQLTQEFVPIRSGFGMVTQQLNTLTNLLQSPVNPDPNAPAATPGDTNAQPGGPLTPINVPSSPAVYLNAAMNDYMANRLDNAVDGFNDFLKKFPDAPDAPKAQFYIGESLFDGGKMSDAIKAYGLVVSNYKSSDYVSQAYYKQGLAYLELNQRANAQKVFDIIVKQFPNSAEAALVKQRPTTTGKD